MARRSSLQSRGPLQLGSALLDMGLAFLLSLLFAHLWAQNILLSVDLQPEPLSLTLVQALCQAFWLLVFLFPKISASLLAAGGGLTALLALLLPAAGVREALTRLFLAIKDSILWSFTLSQSGIVQPASYPLLIALMTASLSIYLVWKQPMPLLLLSLMLFPLLGAKEGLIPEPTQFWSMALASVVVAYVFARRPARYRFKLGEFQMPPLPLLAGLLALSLGLSALLPGHFYRNEALAAKMKEIKRILSAPETVNYYEFSLRDVGFYPDYERMGGPVEEAPQAYMQVEGPQNGFYLRGSLADHYLGHAWEVQDMDPNYAFRNESPSKRQAEIFNWPKTLPGGEALLKEFFSKDTVSIQPLTEHVQVVFHGGRPERLQSLEEEEQVFYYNDQGQIYAGQVIQAPGYRQEGWLYQPGKRAADWERLLRLVEAGRLSLPKEENLASDLRMADPALAAQMAHDGTPASRLRAFFQANRYMMEHYQYRLDVPYPPPAADFFDYFLQSKEGYCVYFATASSLLARELGIPSRYVEGFLVPASETGSRVVEQGMAHAWTEIKIEGLGWFPVDATPSEQQGEESEEPEASAEPSERTEPPPPTSPPSTAEASPPTSPPAAPERPTAPPTSAPPPAVSPLAKTLTRWGPLLLGLLLFLLALLAFLLWRRRVYQQRHDQAFLLSGKRYRLEDLPRLIYQDLQGILQILAPEERGQQSVLRQMARLAQLLPGLHGAQQASLWMDQAYYAKEGMPPEALPALLAYHAQVEEALKARLPWWRWCFLRYLWSAKHPL